MEIQIKRRFDEKELMDMASVKLEAKKLAKDLAIGQTLFMKKYGVKSEGEFKRKIMQTGEITKHSQIGWNDWNVTAKGIKKIHDELEAQGSFITRFGVALDWIMGVPESYRDKFQVGGSLVLKTEEEWKALGQAAPVQPHLGDHMIGSLNSVENASLGLKAGVTSIGNISHYYTYEYPGLDMEEYRTNDFMKAIALMANFSEEGAIIHSNLDDGYGGQFHDLANLVGWAKLERYIVEELLGARLATCYGNLFSDSMFRVVFNRAMSMINKYNTPGTFVNGNTIDYGLNIPKNFGALAAYSMADVICQMKYPSGYAIAPIPLTEAIRVPSADEIIEAHLAVDMMIEKAPYYEKFIDWDKINSEAEILVTGGNSFFERTLNALDDLGVDINHAGEIVSVLKAIGPEQLETTFGAGLRDKEAMRGRVPIRSTSIVKTINKIQDDVVSRQKHEHKNCLTGVNVVLGSTDVHEFGKEVIKNILRSSGATVFDLGTTVSIAEIADTLVETSANVLCISTYNGIAYSFARDLLKNLENEDIHDVHVIMGGRLNEPIDGSDLPIDVAPLLAEMGINADNNIETIVDTIVSYNKNIVG